MQFVETHPAYQRYCRITETKSCENVLDAVYGDSWRALKDKILPKSEKKPSVKKPSVVKPAPATEG